MPKDTLIKSPKWAGLGVEGRGSATFIYTLIEKMSKGQSTPSSAFPSDTDLVYVSLSYQLWLVLRSGFQGILRLTLPRPGINPVAWPGSSLRMGWWNTALSTARDKGCTPAQA